MERATKSVKRVTTAIAERLPPEHLAWLKEFSVVMHRRFTYPAHHPLRVASEESALAAINRALEQLPEIAMGVSRHQVAIGGGFSDVNNHTLSELAERLHRQGIGSITIRAGVTPEEFDALLTRIVNAAPKGADDHTAEQPQPGVHVAIEMLTYEGLALNEFEGDDEQGADVTADRLWHELAQMTLTGWDGEDMGGRAGGGSSGTEGARAGTEGARTSRSSGPVGAAADGGGVPGGAAVDGGGVPGGADAPGASASAPPPARPSGGFAAHRPSAQLSAIESAERLAKVINARAGEPEFASDVLKSLIRVGRHARRSGRAGSGAVAARLRDVMHLLGPGTLQTLLGSEPNPERLRVLFLQGVDALPVSAVLDWIEAAAGSTERSISPYLLRMLKKLSSQARRRRDAGPDEGGEALRQAAKQLIDGWSLQTNETEAHSALLEHIANHEGSGRPVDGGDLAGADRIVQMALETDVFGSDVMAAVDHLIDGRRLGLLLSYLDRMPESNTAVPSIRDHLESRETLRRVLLTEPIEADGARELLSRCGPAHAEALLDALAISESQATRHLILHRMREIGEAASDQIVARLEGAPWYVQRNLLMLLAALPTLPARLKVEAFARHEEPTVRTEALKLRVRIPARRDEAIHEGLADPDLRVVRAALEAAVSGLPHRSGLRLLQVAQKTEMGSDTRLRAVALLDQVGLTAARDWLLPQVIRRRGLFVHWLALRPNSPDMIAALRVLAARWRNDKAVAPVFRLAAKSDDPLVRDAARVPEGA